MRTPLVLCLATLLATPAAALDLNSFRAAHHRPALAMSSELSGIASSRARELAGGRRLDHRGFRERARTRGSASAENVAVIACARPDAKPAATFAGRACGCDSEDCVIKLWARSAGHRRNMLMGGVSAYGLASATASNGRKYWALELGN